MKIWMPVIIPITTRYHDNINIFIVENRDNFGLFIALKKHSIVTWVTEELSFINPNLIVKHTDDNFPTWPL